MYPKLNLRRIVLATALGFAVHQGASAQTITSYPGSICVPIKPQAGWRLALRPSGLVNLSSNATDVICPIPRAVGTSAGPKSLDLAINFTNAGDPVEQRCVLREFTASGSRLQQQRQEREIANGSVGALEWRASVDDSRVSQLTVQCTLQPQVSLAALTLSVGATMDGGSGGSGGSSGGDSGEFEFEGIVNAFESGESVTVNGDTYTVSASTRYFIDNVGPVTTVEFFQQLSVGRRVEVTDYLPVDGVADELYLEDPTD